MRQFETTGCSCAKKSSDRAHIPEDVVKRIAGKYAQHSPKTSTRIGLFKHSVRTTHSVSVKWVTLEVKKVLAETIAGFDSMKLNGK